MKWHDRYIKTYAVTVDKTRNEVISEIKTYLSDNNRSSSFLSADRIHGDDVSIEDYSVEIEVHGGAPGYSLHVKGKIIIHIRETDDPRKSILHCRLIPGSKYAIIMLVIILFAFSIGALLDAPIGNAIMMMIFAWTVFLLVLHVSYKVTAVRLEDLLFAFFFKANLLSAKEKAKRKHPKYGYW